MSDRSNLLRGCSLFLALLLLLPSCTTVPGPDETARQAMRAAIATEAPGDYFIGRRYYKKDYKMWGWVRRPREPWSKAQLVMFNEQQRYAPDRQTGNLGVDNNHEYRLEGYFSGETVYEPASDRFYPEFVLRGYQLLSASPPNIFQSPRATDPTYRLLAPPM